MAWTQKTRDRWERHDGAVVKRSTDEYYAQPWLAGHRGWIAFEPNPSTNYLRMSNGRVGWPRRWKTPEAAMRAVDREYVTAEPVTEK